MALKKIPEKFQTLSNLFQVGFCNENNAAANISPASKEYSLSDFDLLVELACDERFNVEELVTPKMFAAPFHALVALLHLGIASHATPIQIQSLAHRLIILSRKSGNFVEIFSATYTACLVECGEAAVDPILAEIKLVVETCREDLALLFVPDALHQIVFEKKSVALAQKIVTDLCAVALSLLNTWEKGFYHPSVTSLLADFFPAIGKLALFARNNDTLGVLRRIMLGPLQKPVYQNSHSWAALLGSMGIEPSPLDPAVTDKPIPRREEVVFMWNERHGSEPPPYGPFPGQAGYAVPAEWTPLVSCDSNTCTIASLVRHVRSPEDMLALMESEAFRDAAKAPYRHALKDLKTCGKCHAVLYCSPECQMHAWARASLDKSVSPSAAHTSKPFSRLCSDYVPAGDSHKTVCSMLRAHLQSS